MVDEIDHDFTSQLKLLGMKIKKARIERGLSVRDMVVQHDYHEAQWRRYERGSSLTIPSLMRVAKALGTSLSVLLKGVGDFTPPHVAKKTKGCTKAHK